MIFKTVIFFGLLSVNSAFILNEIRCCPCGGLTMHKDKKFECIHALLPSIDLNNTDKLKINRTTADSIDNFFLSSKYHSSESEISCYPTKSSKATTFKENVQGKNNIKFKATVEKPDKCMEIIFDEDSKKVALAEIQLVKDQNDNELLESEQKNEKLIVKKCCEKGSHIDVDKIECREFDNLKEEYQNVMTEYPLYYEDEPLNWPDKNYVITRPEYLMSKDQSENRFTCIQDMKAESPDYLAMYLVNGVLQRFTTTMAIILPIILTLKFF